MACEQEQQARDDAQASATIATAIYDQSVTDLAAASVVWQQKQTAEQEAFNAYQNAVNEAATAQSEVNFRTSDMQMKQSARDQALADLAMAEQVLADCLNS